MSAYLNVKAQSRSTCFQLQGPSLWFWNFNLLEGLFPALLDTDRPVLEVECAAVARPDQLRVGGERAAVRAAAAHREPLARLCRVEVDIKDI